MPAPSDDERFNTEVVKVLLQLAFADGEVDDAEVNLIFGAGRSWGVDEQQLHTLLQLLKLKGPLPQPDLALLRTRADEVMIAARALVLTDGKVKKEETAMLKSLQQLLAGA